MATRILIVLSCAVVLCAGAANAQMFARNMNPEVGVPVEHPPELPFYAKRVIFERPRDLCETSVTGSLAASFRSAGIQTLDGGRLASLLERHAGDPNGSGDPAATMLAVGRAAGPSVHVTVRSTLCDVAMDQSTSTRKVRLQQEKTATTTRETKSNGDQVVVTTTTITGRPPRKTPVRSSHCVAPEGWQRPGESVVLSTDKNSTTVRASATEQATGEGSSADDGGETTTTTTISTTVNIVDHVAQTTADVAVSVGMRDLTLDRHYDERAFESEATVCNLLSMERPWSDARPKQPTDTQVVRTAVDQMAGPMNRIFFPWSETLPVVFYNNRKCELKTAYRTLRDRHVQRALEMSDANLTTCLSKKRTGKKIRSNAHYNLGIVQSIVGDYEAALLNLQTARSLRPGKVVEEALQKVEKAQAAAQARQRHKEEVESIAAAWAALAAR